MLQDEEQRNAYLHLMTSFIMEASNRDMKKHNSTPRNDKEMVRYMISDSADGELVMSSSGVQLYSSIKLGMPESKVLQLSNHICTERGYVLVNDMCKRLYMHIEKNAQIWIELTQHDIDEEAVVTFKSGIEPKSTWKVYLNNILKVSS